MSRDYGENSTYLNSQLRFMCSAYGGEVVSAALSQVLKTKDNESNRGDVDGTRYEG